MPKPSLIKHSYKVSCAKDKLREIRIFVENSLKDHVPSEVDRANIIMAIDEVCANLIIHSNNCDPDKNFEVIIEVEKDKEIIFQIVDQGVGFNLERYREPDLKYLMAEQRKGGMGLMFVVRVMDDVKFTTRSKKNICRLVKRLNGQ